MYYLEGWTEFSCSSIPFHACMCENILNRNVHSPSLGLLLVKNALREFFGAILCMSRVCLLWNYMYDFWNASYMDETVQYICTQIPSV